MAEVRVDVQETVDAQDMVDAREWEDISRQTQGG